MPIHTIFVVYLGQIFRCKTVFIQQQHQQYLLSDELSKAVLTNTIHKIHKSHNKHCISTDSNLSH